MVRETSEFHSLAKHDKPTFNEWLMEYGFMAHYHKNYFVPKTFYVDNWMTYKYIKCKNHLIWDECQSKYGDEQWWTKIYRQIE